MKTRVTVVVPCFQDGATIEEAIASICENEPVPVVIVDDGSQDEATGRTLEKIAAKNSGVAVLTHPTNRGVAAAINTGIRAAKTDYAFLLNADDKVAPHAIGHLADLLDANPHSAVAWGAYELFEATAGRVDTPPMDPWQLTYVNRWPGVALVRVSAFTAVGGMAAYSMYEDWDMWMRLVKNGYGGVVSDEVTFHYRIHHGTARRCAQATDRFGREYRILRAMHPELFERRSELRRASPLSEATKLREQIGLWLLLLSPRQGRRALRALGAVVRKVRARSA